MDTLETPPSVESLRERVSEFERERARLCRELSAPARDPRFRVVQVAVFGLLAVSFACGLCAGEQFGLPRIGERPFDPNKPLPVVRLPK